MQLLTQSTVLDRINHRLAREGLKLHKAQGKPYGWYFETTHGPEIPADITLEKYARQLGVLDRTEGMA